MAEKNETPKPITFDWNGTDYTMEFNRATVKVAEQRYGITMGSFNGDLKLSMLPDLFYCSLLMHHPNIKHQTADAMFDLMEDKQALLMALYELFSAPIGAILADPDGEEGKVIRWKK